MWAATLGDPEPFTQALIYSELSAFEMKMHPTLQNEAALLFDQAEIEPWFFEPQPDGCPTSPPVPSAEVEQSFQHGSMIWIQPHVEQYAYRNCSRVPIRCSRAMNSAKASELQMRQVIQRRWREHLLWPP